MKGGKVAIGKIQCLQKKKKKKKKKTEKKEIVRAKGSKV